MQIRDFFPSYCHTECIEYNHLFDFYLQVKLVIQITIHSLEF